MAGGAGPLDALWGPVAASGGIIRNDTATIDCCRNAPSIDQVIDIIILMYCTVINTQLTHHFSFAPTHPGYI